MAFNNLLVWLRLLQYFSAVSRSLGVLIIMIFKMLEDMLLWIGVSITFLCAFSVTFLGTARSEAPFESQGPMGLAPWAMYGEFTLANVR